MSDRKLWLVVAALAASALILVLVLRPQDAGQTREAVVALPQVRAAEPPESTEPAMLEIASPVTTLESAATTTEPPASDSERTEAPVPRPAWVDEIMSASPEALALRKRSMTLADHVDLLQKHMDYTAAISGEEFMRMFKAREWEVVVPPDASGKVQPYTPTEEDSKLILRITNTKEDGVCKLVLSREKFPELYALKERVDSMRGKLD